MIKLLEIRLHSVAIDVVLVTMLFAALLRPTIAWGASDQWTSLGPEGGSILTIAVDPSVPSRVYVGTFRSGVFKSTDGAASWRGVSEDFAASLTNFNAHVQTIVVDPATPSTLYAGLQCGGIWKSTDNGESWVGSLPHFINLEALAIDPTNPSIVYGSKGIGACSGANNADILKSTDAGASWSVIATLPASTQGARTLAVSPTGSPIYAGGSDGVYRSTDGGQSWVASNNGLGNVGVSSIAVDPTGVLYAGTYAGVFKSVDQATTWSPANTGLIGPPSVSAVAIAPSNPSTIYAAAGDVFKSTNAGGTWTAVPTGEAAIGSLAIDASTPTVVYAGSGTKLYKTSDGGSTWAVRTTGLVAQPIDQLAVAPATPSTLYAQLFISSFAKTTDGGATFAILGNAGAYNDLVVDPNDTNIVYGASSGGGVNKSVDGGVTFTSMNTGLPGAPSPTVTSLVVGVGSSSTIFAGTSGDGVFKTTNGGTTWSPSNVNIEHLGIWSLANDPTNPNVLFAAAIVNGVFKSTDGGASWVPKNAGLPGNDADIYAIAIDPLSPNTWYAGLRVGTGLFKSINGGNSWNEIDVGLPFGESEGIFSIICDPVHAGVLYVGTRKRIFQSNDGGGTWKAIDNSLPELFTYIEVPLLALDPSSPENLYVGTTRGIFKRQLCHDDAECVDGNSCTVDACAPWDPAADGFGCANVPGNAGVVCRPAVGVCDSAESCTGVTPNCPPDALATVGTVCRSSAGICDPAETCSGVGTTCPADVKSTAECRPAAGACDIAETCDGVGNACPEDILWPASTVCRAAAGPCDITEVCSGTSAQCPANTVQAVNTVCRPAADECDAAEKCDGVGAQCPVDALLPSGTQCRAASGECDVAETCDGVSMACPFDALEPNGTPCGDDGNVCTDDSCNGAGTCTHPNNTAACDDGDPCSTGDTCAGGSCSGVLTDSDADGRFNGCDNCPAVYNPDQQNSDVRDGGDLCDVCPADPSDQCDAGSSTAMTLGGGGGTVSAPDGTVSIAIPPGVLSGPTSISITGGLAGSNFGLAAGSTILLTELQPEGVTFDPPAVVTFRWQDDDDDGRVDGTGIAERNLKIFRNGTVLFPAQPCGDFDGAGCTPASCCSQTANTWTFQRSTFSEYGLSGDCIPVGDRTSLTIGKLDTPPGDDRLSFKGYFTLPDGVSMAALDPLAHGLDFVLSDASGAVADVVLAPGAFDAGTRIGWKVNGTGTKWSYTNKSTPPNGIFQAQLQDKSSMAPGLVKFQLKGKNGSYQAGTAVAPFLFLPGMADCIEGRFSGPSPNPTCVLSPKGTTLKCK